MARSAPHGAGTPTSVPRGAAVAPEPDAGGSRSGAGSGAGSGPGAGSGARSGRRRVRVAVPDRGHAGGPRAASGRARRGGPERGAPARRAVGAGERTRRRGSAPVGAGDAVGVGGPGATGVGGRGAGGAVGVGAGAGVGGAGVGAVGAGGAGGAGVTRGAGSSNQSSVVVSAASGAPLDHPRYSPHSTQNCASGALLCPQLVHAVMAEPLSRQPFLRIPASGGGVHLPAWVRPVTCDARSAARRPGQPEGDRWPRWCARTAAPAILRGGSSARTATASWTGPAPKPIPWPPPPPKAAPPAAAPQQQVRPQSRAGPGSAGHGSAVPGPVRAAPATTAPAAGAGGRPAAASRGRLRTGRGVPVQHGAAAADLCQLRHGERADPPVLPPLRNVARHAQRDDARPAGRAG